MSYSDLGQWLWNCDKTGICISVSTKKVLIRRGTRAVAEVGCGSGREHRTTLFCGSAVGEKLPPYVIYKVETIDYGWAVGGHPDTLFSVSSSGWMETSHFQQWFGKLFLPADESLAKTGRVVLFLDGYDSHTALELIGRAKAKNITLYCLPPHTTPFTAPGCGCLAHLSLWRRAVREHKLATNASQISKHIFPSLFSRLYSESVLPEHLVSRFQAAGIYPLSQSHQS